MPSNLYKTKKNKIYHSFYQSERVCHWAACISSTGLLVTTLSKSHRTRLAPYTEQSVQLWKVEIQLSCWTSRFCVIFWNQSWDRDPVNIANKDIFQESELKFIDSTSNISHLLSISSFICILVFSVPWRYHNLWSQLFLGEQHRVLSVFVNWDYSRESWIVNPPWGSIPSHRRRFILAARPFLFQTTCRLFIYHLLPARRIKNPQKMFPPIESWNDTETVPNWVQIKLIVTIASLRLERTRQFCV